MSEQQLATIGVTHEFIFADDTPDTVARKIREPLSEVLAGHQERAKDFDFAQGDSGVPGVSFCIYTLPGASGDVGELYQTANSLLGILAQEAGERGYTVLSSIPGPFDFLQSLEEGHIRQDNRGERFALGYLTNLVRTDHIRPHAGAVDSDGDPLWSQWWGNSVSERIHQALEKLGPTVDRRIREALDRFKA